MRSALDRQDRMAGIFILVSLLCTAGFVVGSAVQNRWFVPRVSYHTTLEQAGALREGSPILYSGVEIGSLGALSLKQDSGIDVELRILEEHAPRVRQGVVVEVRRVLGLGQKRVHLIASTQPGAANAPQLAAGTRIPAREPMDLMDAMTAVDLGRISAVLQRTLVTTELLLSKLEEDNRLERLVGAFDQLAPTMEHLNTLLTDVDEPLVALLSDPNLKRTLRGTAKVFNDPATLEALHGAAEALDPKELGPLMERTDRVLAKLEGLLAQDSHLHGALAGADKVLGDMGERDKLGRLIDGVALLTEQMGQIGPQMPRLTRDLLLTLREAVVVLKALQKTWLLNDEAGEARRELLERDAINRKRDAKKK